MKKWTQEQINEFIRFKTLVRSRLDRGESERSAFRDKPYGFSEWLKDNFEETGGVKLPPIPTISKYTCWNCGKEYQGRKCPYCKAFKPKSKTYK